MEYDPNAPARTFQSEHLDRLATPKTSMYGEHVARDPLATSNGWPETPGNFRGVQRPDEHMRSTEYSRYRYSSPTEAGWAQKKYNMPATDSSSSGTDADWAQRKYNMPATGSSRRTLKDK